MNYKIISMDFDGTLLTTDKKITERTKNILLKYRENNHIIVGVTARNLTSLKRVCDITMFNYLVLNNGTYIYDVENETGEDIGNLDNETVSNLTNYFKNVSQAIYYCSPENYYIYSTKIDKPHDYFIKINSHLDLKEPIARMNIYGENTNEVIKYKQDIEENFKNIDSIIMEDSDRKPEKKWIAINPKGINKLVTLEKLCKKLNISLKDVIFFGDGPNDVEIIQQVGLGIAMENALPEVKKLAKKITLSNNDDGIAIFLENN